MAANSGVTGSIWTGKTATVEMVPSAATWSSTYVLDGEGAYEGMHALLRGAPGHDAHGPWDDEYEGWIIESDVPSLPEPPEAL